jgi:subtilisin-like proprotein convertase family protein
MRRQSTELRSQGTRPRTRDEARGASVKRSRLRRLALEGLEARTLLATTPIPVVTNQVAASAGVGGVNINDSNPSIAVNPLDSNKLIAAFTDRDTSSGTTLYFARVTFSNDGGRSWNLAVDQPIQSFDPTSTTGAKLQDTVEGVGFDRAGHAYVGVLETNNSNAGDVVVDKYDFSGSSPTKVVIGSFGSNSVYSWNQAATNASLQPTVLNFSLAVDGNVASFSDPLTGAVQSDSNTGAVYVAWTLNSPPPPNVTNWNPYTIQVVGSANGQTWPAFDLSGVPGATTVSLGNFGGQRYTAPQVAVAQGKVGGSGAGEVSVVFDDYTSGNNSNPPVDLIEYSRLIFNGTSLADQFGPNGFETIAFTTVRGAQTGTNFPLGTPSSPTGIGPAPVIAVDNTLGSFSAHQGRIYVSYVDRSTATGNPSDNTDVMLIASDNDGATWFPAGAPGSATSTISFYSGTVVNDDDGTTDGHTAGAGGLQGRPQYQPSIAVDNSTGTLVMSWLDVRDDASLQRYADYLAYSIDGGASFAPQTFADLPNVVTDATTGSTFVAGPYSGNESGGNPNSETSTSFGTHQGLAVSNGVIHPAWATTGKNIRGDARLTITTARATIPSGPRITFGTSGSTGATSLSNFLVAFDRPVSIASFNNPNQVVVQFLNAKTGVTSNVAVASITALNPQGALNAEATTFQINFASVQTGVGTYSYEVKGTSIRDLVRSQGQGTIVSDPSGTAAITATSPTPVLPQAITDGAPPTVSKVTLSGAPPADVVDLGQAVTVNGLTIHYPTTGGVPSGVNPTPLSIFLISPSGQTILLAAGVGSLSNATLTTSAFSGVAINGDWSLRIVDSNNANQVGQLAGWSLHVNAGTPSASPVTTGNLMDQNANGIGGEVTDYFANPMPVTPTANPFAGPYDPTTLPIVIAGPHVTGTFVTGGVNDPTGSAQPGNNLRLNGTVSSIDVTFSVPMDPSTFTAAQVLSMTGPTGPIVGPFTVAPDPQTGENPSFPNTFKVSFPTQQLSGTYNLTLGAGLKSQGGIGVDNNQNAGVSLLLTNAQGLVPQGPATFTSAQTAAITPGTPASPSSVSTSITIPANAISLIQDFKLQLNIAYPNDPDLTATLTTPIIDPVTQQPFTVLLFSGNGSASGSQANYTNTVFQDSAATLIGNGAPPFLGQFKPLQSLLVNGHLLGASEAGTYTLTIKNAGSGAGTLTGWSITTTPKTTTNTGLGEPVADQTAASFRIFTMDPTNPLSSNTWTAVGPASANSGGNSGRVSAIAVDASDPSGNTVYVAGASGGVWKTTDFLTTKSGGPTYTLLTGNAQGNALNIGSIAVFSRNNDPNQSIIVAGTGEGNTAQPGVQGSSTVGTSAGVGFLISYDGGKSWTLDDSLVNYNAQGQVLPTAQRVHEFVGTSTYKIIIDPKPTPDNNIIIYAALGGGQNGPNGQGGVYRSIDSGHTWQLMRAGYATDIVFDPNSGTVNAVNTSGNLLILYAAFLGEGVFLSPTQGQTWNPMNGGVGDPLVQNFFQGKFSPVPVNAPGATPSGGGGRIVLAKPALTGNALLDAEFETWLYAAVVTPAGAFNGLFVTKDNGANWTDALLPNALAATATAAQGLDPSNNIGQSNYNITGGQGNYDFALAVDPNDPNITYIGGSADFGPTTMIRVDITRLSDPYSLYTSTETLGGQILKNTTSPVTIKDPTNLFLTGFDPLSDPFTNIYRNPVNVFSTGSTVHVFDTGSFANDGSGAWWTPFDGFIGGTDVHTIVPMLDPTTGKTRLLVGYDQGIATGIDNNGALLSSIGNQSLASGVRNGNIQITQFYNGAAQPSALAAQIAGALFFGEAQDDGFPTSNPNVLINGNIGWFGSTGDGTDVATDATGSGTTYQSTWPCCNTAGPSNFFQVNGIGRTFGLLQSTSVPPGPSLPGTSDPQWPYGPSSNFAVNPVNNQEMIIASRVGRLFVTQDQGVIWSELAEPTVFDSTTIPALAYGAPDPGAPLNGALGNYMLVGTDGGHIYVTFTGGGGAGGNAWVNMTPNGLGAPVQRIVTDPTRGTHDAYAITTNAVFYNANTQAATSTWVNVTGDLFSQTTTPFGAAALATQALLQLGGLAVDWRYVIPFDPTNPSKGTHPMLYVGGIGGVFRSTNNGTNWTAFPDQTLATPVPDGNLPAATVSDLDMVLGNVDPTTGHPNVSTGPNLLLATTYGSGSYGIRLAPIVFNDGTNKVTESQNTTTGVLTFKGLSEQSAFGTAVAVTVQDITDPNNPIYLGGYNPADGLPTGSPTFNNIANQTDVNGKFSVSGSYPAAPANNPFFFDGLRKVAIFATDASGTKGNVVTFQITNNLPAPTSAPIFENASNPPIPLTNGVASGGTVITTSTQAAPALTFQFTVPNPGLGQTIGVTLIRVDNQQVATPVGTASRNGTNSGTPLTGTIQDPGPVPVGTYTYEFQYTVTVAGQPTNSPLSPTTTVQVVAPMAAPNLFFQDDSGTPGDGITNVTRPRFTGTAVPNVANDQGLKLKLVETAFNGIPLGTPAVLNSPLSVDPVNGQYLLQPAAALADGTYSLVVVATDAAGDSITSSPLTLTISTKAPTKTPTIALQAASIIPSNNPNATVARRPVVEGMTDNGATVVIFGSLNGGPVFQLATATALSFPNGGHPAGYYQAQLPSNLNDGSVTLYAFARNAAGNTNPNFGTLALKIFSLPGDYTGVGKAGLAVYSPSTGTYTFAHAGTGITTTIAGFGLPNVDIPVPGDYNGDGQTDPAIYRPTNGYWAIDVNSQAVGQYIQYVPPIIPPGPGVVPAPADFDTDGQTDPAVYSIVPFNGVNFGVFTILHTLVGTTNTSSLQSLPWGLAGDTPVPGDYDAAGSAQVAVYRPTTGAWYVRSSGAAGGAATPAGKSEPPVFVTAFQAGDVPVQGDYDGIGRLEEAIYRPSTQTFYIYNPNTRATRQVTMPKLAGQGANDVIIPASADFTGDGKVDAAIFDQNLGTFEYINSATNAVFSQAFYLTKQDIPLTAPEQYRANVGAQAALQRTSVILANTPASPPSGPAFSPVTGTNSTSAAVVVGATVPTGLTSTGKTNTRPPIPVPTPAPVVVITPGTSVNRPAQDTTDSALASLGKSYQGTFI